MANQTLHSPAKGQQASPSALTHSADDIPQAVLNDGYAAAHEWYVDTMERMEALCREEGARQKRNIVSGYCVDSRLRRAFAALPVAQRGAFLDAVGAYIVAFLAYGEPTKECRFTSDDLAMFASTPAEQDAWARSRDDDEVQA